MEGEELVDDIFATAFDEEMGKPPVGEAEPEPEKVEPEVKVEPEAKVEPEVKPEPVVAPLTLEDVSKTVEAAIAKAKPVEPEPAPAVEVEDPVVVEALKDFEEQWPTQKVAVNALLGKALKAQETALEAKFGEKLAAIEARLTPVLESTQASAVEAHMKAIVEVAGEPMATFVPKVEAWIAKQPEYLQPVYNKILDEGSTVAVTKFFTDFKAATGTPAPAAKVDEKRLARMEAPASVRTSVSAEEEPDDFDSAFDSEAKKLKLAS